MEFFLIILAAGAIAFSWRRIDELERRLAEMTERLDLLAGGGVRESVEAAPVREEQATPASPAVPEITPKPEAVEQAEPPATPEQAYADTTGDGDVDQSEVVTPDEYVEEAPPGPRFVFDFEDIFGRRLPIWGGGFALAIAGIFLVRFSIEAGLLTAGVRVALSFVFGVALIVGGEAAYRFEHRLKDPRVRQALAGAGLATLYGAFYLAGTAYGLVGAGVAFAGLAAVTAAAIGLSFRFGLPSAVIALVGGFAAPVLVDSDSSNVPLLSFYLALVTGGLVWAGQAQGRNWLGLAALAAGIGWGALMIFGGVDSRADFAAVGAYLVVLGTVLPAFLRTKGGPRLPVLAAGAIATLQMAVLVSSAEFEPLTWGLYLLIGAALAGLGWRFAELRAGTLVAAGLGLWLLFMWSGADPQFFAAVAAAQVAIFALVPLAYQWLGRARHVDLAQMAIVVLGIALAVWVEFANHHFSNGIEPEIGASFAALALIPAAAFAIMWRREDESSTREALTLLLPSWLLGFLALLLFTPGWLAPVMAAAVLAPILWCYALRDTRAILITFWIGAAMVIFALAVSNGFLDEFERLGEIETSVDITRALVRWGAAALPFVAMAALGRDGVQRGFAEVGATVLIYGIIAQVAPTQALPWIAAVGAIAILLRWDDARIAAWSSAFAITAMWAAKPILIWLIAGIEAMIGTPFMANAAIEPLVLGWRVAPVLVVIGMIVWQNREGSVGRLAPFALVFGLVAAIVLHSLYKQVFDINSLLRFEWYGMGERTGWQALLMAGGFAALRWRNLMELRAVGIGLVVFSLTHFGWFTLVLHNPLFNAQHVGPAPIANWLLPAYLTAIVGLWLIREQLREGPALLRAALDAGKMALISLLSLSLLRQFFSGTDLTSTSIYQTESLLISLLGIVLALGFLWWGSWRQARSWRIGSLVLMLAAVIKVFLIDAAGLEGLLRVASFMALGFSLIGIGWVYTKQLAGRRPAPSEPAEPTP